MSVQIITNTIGEAHERVVDFIRKRGEIIQTEDKEWTTEAIDVKIRVANPFDEPRISKYCFMGKRGFEEYANNIVYGYSKHIGFIYDYHTRLFDWGGGSQDDGMVTYTGKTPQDTFYIKGKTDQVEYIIDKLKSDITSRRALATTWIPPLDEKRKDVPCLQLVQFLVRNNKLEMFVVFRSEDMLSGFGQNAYGLTMLQKYIAKELDISIGSYHHYVISGHIYHIRDSHELSMFPEV